MGYTRDSFFNNGGFIYTKFRIDRRKYMSQILNGISISIS